MRAEMRGLAVGYVQYADDLASRSPAGSWKCAQQMKRYLEFGLQNHGLNYCKLS
jgi:hypothetical protein